MQAACFTYRLVSYFMLAVMAPTDESLSSPKEVNGVKKKPWGRLGAAVGAVALLVAGGLVGVAGARERRRRH